jgi:hypothetical protein
VFACVDHVSAEACASVDVRADRLTAVEPLYDAVRDNSGPVGPEAAAHEVASRHDWGAIGQPTGRRTKYLTRPDVVVMTTQWR